MNTQSTFCTLRDSQKLPKKILNKVFSKERKGREKATKKAKDLSKKAESSQD